MFHDPNVKNETDKAAEDLGVVPCAKQIVKIEPYKGEKQNLGLWGLLVQTVIWLVYDIFARLSGKPRPGQRPLLDFGGLGWWLVSTASLVIWFPLLVLGAGLIETAGIWNLILLPVIFVMQVIFVGCLRVQQVTFAHYAVHGSLSKRPWLNKIVAQFATIVPLAQNPAEYRADHVQKHHRTRFFTSIHDPDAAFLLQLGFRPGMSRRQLYAHLWRTIFSPRFHGLFAIARLRSTFMTSDTVHKTAAALWLMALLGLAFIVPWWVFLLAVIMPWGPLYHISSLIQFLTEHRWAMTERGPSNSGEYADRCVGRFSLLPTPTGETGIRLWLAWARWSALMIPEILVRLGSWVGDLPAHDHHHLAGHVGHNPEDWPKAIFERQRSIDEGDPAGLANREVYGLKAALDWVFDGLSDPKD